MSLGRPLATPLVKFALALLCTAALTACGGGGGAGSSAVAPAGGTSLSGSVGDGPVVGATVTVYAASGTALASTVSTQSAAYSFNLNVSAQDYPLTLEVTGGTDLVTGRAPDFRLVSVAMTPTDSRANINPFSTLAVEIAGNMPGGLTGANLAQAKQYVVQQMGFGLDSASVADPITTPITAANVAQIVKASEALGELIRRTRDALVATGASLSGDAVVVAIAADMNDGFLDGSGALATDPTVSAVANVVTGQVLVETLSNSLKVDGALAATAMDASIRVTTPQALASQLTGSVLITGTALDQLDTALAAAQSIDSSPALGSLRTDLQGINVGDSAQAASLVISPDRVSSLNSAVTLVSLGNLTQVAAVNGSVNPDAGDTSGGQGGTGSGVGATGNATLNWAAPASRSDGTALALSEIGGFRIHYGSSAGNYPNTLDVPDPNASSVTVTNIPVGDYYFVMTAYDTSGRESGYSATVVKTVN